VEIDGGGLTTIQAVGLYATVIGVVVGRLLSQLTEIAKWYFERKRIRIAVPIERGRSTFSGPPTMGHNSSGPRNHRSGSVKRQGSRSDSERKEFALTESLNESLVSIQRLRVESYVLGPEWLFSGRCGSWRSSHRTQIALGNTDDWKQESFRAYVAEHQAFVKVREELLEAVKDELSPQPEGSPYGAGLSLASGNESW
jgi:hypothetical protein